jgi:hypothetical protein
VRGRKKMETREEGSEGRQIQEVERKEERKKKEGVVPSK